MPQILIEPGTQYGPPPIGPKHTRHKLSRPLLRVAHRLLKILEDEDQRTRQAAGEPGAYGYVHDQIARLMVDHPDPPCPHDPAYGQPVRLRCGATGRYIAGGYGLYVSAQDNSLRLDQVGSTGVVPTRRLPLPSDDACEAAAITYSLLLPGA